MKRVEYDVLYEYNPITNEYDPDAEPMEVTMVVIPTDEGIVIDLVHEGQIIAMWGRTAQEIADTLL